MLTLHHLNEFAFAADPLAARRARDPLRDKLPARRHTRLAPPELKKIHPLGKSPVITDSGRTSPSPVRSSIHLATTATAR